MGCDHSKYSPRRESSETSQEGQYWDSSQKRWVKTRTTTKTTVTRCGNCGTVLDTDSRTWRS